MKEILTEYEVQAGLVAKDQKRSANFKTLDELIDDYKNNPAEYTGITIDDRIKFLEANGYEVTRKNILADLSAKTKK